MQIISICPPLSYQNYCPWKAERLISYFICGEKQGDPFFEAIEENIKVSVDSVSLQKILPPLMSFHNVLSFSLNFFPELWVIGNSYKILENLSDMCRFKRLWNKFALCSKLCHSFFNSSHTQDKNFEISFISSPIYSLQANP